MDINAITKTLDLRGGNYAKQTSNSKNCKAGIPIRYVYIWRTKTTSQNTNAGFDYIQIHGELSDDVYNACSVRIIRAVNIKHQSEEDIYLETKRWRSLDKIYGLLFDAGVPGSGKTFDWESLKKADCGNKKLFLAGGLTPDNVKAAIEAVRSDVVDISSGVEYDDVSVKGKDESKVKAFIQNAKF